MALRDALPWHDLIQAVQSAEQTGYSALFLPEITGRETFATLAGIATAVPRLLLASGVVPASSRTAQTTAMAAATVQDLSGGRMVLGIGSGPSEPGALDRLRAYVVAVRRLLAGERVEIDGEAAIRLSLAPRDPPPVWIAALGPRAMRLGGEVADGVLLNWCTPERVAYARERVAEGASDAGRDPAKVTVAVYVRACVGEREAALSALKAAAGQYASYPAYRRQLDAVGLGEEAATAAAAHASRRPGEVPEALVRALCIEGEVREARVRLESYREAGADLPVVYPVPALEPLSSILGTLFALAPAPASSS